MTNVKANWVASPITGREMVIQEFNENYGVCSMDLSSGYYTNELNHNYKKNGYETIAKHEEQMPMVIKQLKFDDGESYWYPSTIQTSTEIVFATGTSIAKIEWHHAKINEGVIDEESVKHYSSYLEAAKQINNHFLGNFNSGN
jgi:hypothetical protein